MTIFIHHNIAVARLELNKNNNGKENTKQLQLKLVHPLLPWVFCLTFATLTIFVLFHVTQV